MKGKWSVGVVSALLVIIALSGCITTGDECFYFGWEESFDQGPFENFTEEYKINTDLNETVVPSGYQYTVKSIDFDASYQNSPFGNAAADVRVVLQRGDDEIFNESTSNDGAVTYLAAQGDTWVLEPVEFKTTEKHLDTAEDKIAGDGRIIKGGNLTLSLWKADDPKNIKIGCMVTYYIFGVYEKGKYEYQFRDPLSRSKEPVGNVTKGGKGTVNLTDKNTQKAHSMKITVGSETEWKDLEKGEVEEVTLTLNVSGGVVFTHTFTKSDNAARIQLWNQSTDPMTFGWFDDNKTAMEAYKGFNSTITQDILIKIKPGSFTGGVYTIELKDKDGNYITKPITVTIEVFEMSDPMGIGLYQIKDDGAHGPINIKAE